MATDKMLLLNLKAYPHGQLPSKFHHRFPVPTVMINRPASYCTTYKRQLILTCSSSSNVTRFVIANTMAASSGMLLTTAEQPIDEGGSCVLTPCHADQTTLDAGSSLLFVVENILNQAAHMADTALLGTQDYLEKLDEKVSKANFSPRLLCTIKQFFSMDKAVIVLSELLALAQNINVTINLQDQMQKVLCNKQYIETPEEIVKAFAGLILPEDYLMQPHTGSSTNKMLSIATANDPFGDEVEHPNAFAFSRTPDRNPASRPQPRMVPPVGKVPGARTKYTFYYASMNGAWLEEFLKKASAVANDPSIMGDKRFSIKLFRIADPKTEEQVQILSKKEGWYEECPKFLHKDDQTLRHFALVRDSSKVVLQGGGRKILTALGDFREHWKKNVPSRGFKNSLIDYYNTLRP